MFSILTGEKFFNASHGDVVPGHLIPMLVRSEPHTVELEMNLLILQQTMGCERAANSGTENLYRLKYR
jgi:hypothetical protein